MLMIVCVCKAVSDRKILQEIDNGATTMADIKKHCTAATDCGSCVPQIRQMLRECGKPHLRLVSNNAA